MTGKETNESIESKIQEIERLVAEFMKEYPEGCSDTNCLNCGLNNNPVKNSVRRYICTLLHAKLFRIRD